MTKNVPAPRPEVLRASPVHHGAPDYAELERLGMAPEDVLDFSVSSNPYGPSPRLWEALRRVPLDRYPDRDALALRRRLAVRLDVAPDRIVAGNGAAELIWLIALAFLRPGDRVLVLGPTFGEYARAAVLMGARVESWTARPERDFVVEPDRVAQILRRVQPRLVFLCSPNNPTGVIISPDVVAAWARAYPRTLFIVDEAYLAFATGLQSTLTIGAGNVLALRSMTKEYALAGLRLGYAVSHEEVIAALARVRPPWNVNSLAQAAGVAALADEEHVHRSLALLAAAREELVAGLQNLGLELVPSAVHFFLVRVGDGAAFRRKLLRRKVQVRDCASFGLPAYVRIAARRPEENARLLEEVERTFQSAV